MRRCAILLLALAACGRDEPVQFPDLDGVARRPLETGGRAASVLLFITTDCPIANAYAPEVSRIIADHADDPVTFHLVHVDPDVTPDKARRHAADYGLKAPVLLDPSHVLVHRTGATVTPEAVVIVPDGSIAYRGRIDDLYADLGQRRARATTRDLRDALAAVLAGRPVAEPRTRAIGCLMPTLPEQ